MQTVQGSGLCSISAQGYLAAASKGGRGQRPQTAAQACCAAAPGRPLLACADNGVGSVCLGLYSEPNPRETLAQPLLRTSIQAHRR